EIMNNQGFSYMLRGDYRRARATLLAARAKDPKSPYIANNLRLLDESASKAKAINVHMLLQAVGLQRTAWLRHGVARIDTLRAKGTAFLEASLFDAIKNF